MQRWKQTALHNKALVLSGAIVALGTVLSTAAIICQVEIAKENNKSTSQQISQLIQAANTQGAAANNFANSASNINSGVGSAVEKLNLQARAIGQLSRDVEAGNKNMMEADRPWMGAVASVANFDVGKKTTFAVTFLNSGRRPARVSFTGTHAQSYPRFPSDPDKEYVFDTTPSTNIAVPGQNILSASVSRTELSEAEMNAVTSGVLTYFLFGKIEYWDAKTNVGYWTHVCIRYMPTMKNETDNGWRNCTDYNEVGELPVKK